MKLLKLVTTAGAIVSILLVWYLAKNMRGDAREQVPAAGVYELSDSQMDALEAAALRGDCAAAERIGRHHLYFSRQYSDATKWYRLAARCPDVNAKTQLIALLKDYPQYWVEVDRLVQEIAHLDPQMAAKARETVNLSKEDAKRRDGK
jgi:hypothetical protein